MMLLYVLKNLASELSLSEDDVHDLWKSYVNAVCAYHRPDVDEFLDTVKIFSRITPSIYMLSSLHINALYVEYLRDLNFNDISSLSP